MNTYLVDNLALGLTIVEAEKPSEAFVRVVTEQDISILDTFLDREDLLERGYQTMEKTHLDGVWLLKR